ncbi:MAG: hypothetical protein ACRCUY_14070 [Thermoguttaceae bacterium]
MCDNLVEVSGCFPSNYFSTSARNLQDVLIQEYEKRLGIMWMRISRSFVCSSKILLPFLVSRL